MQFFSTNIFFLSVYYNKFIAMVELFYCVRTMTNTLASYNRQSSSHINMKNNNSRTSLISSDGPRAGSYKTGISFYDLYLNIRYDVMHDF